jgi:hypothetical protein
LTGTLCGFPLGLGYFVDLFKNRVEAYVRRMVAKTKPKKIIVCMIYYLDEKGGGSWADGALSALMYVTTHPMFLHSHLPLRYNAYPEKLQLMIKKVFELATSKISIPGTEVVPFPLFEVLDGKNTDDYCQRVEPSPLGGEKMAKALMDAVLGDEDEAGADAVAIGPGGALLASSQPRSLT